MNHQPQRIGLFGGTFDPVHNGHVSIASSFLKSGFIDELWILLTPNPPHKLNNNTASYAMRLKMLQAAFSESKSVRISTIENELPRPSYTVHTIRYLKEKHPEKHFKYCMGEDSLAEFHTWKHYKEIIKECRLLVAKRPGVSHLHVAEDILKQTDFVEHRPLAISSTQIRQRIAKRKSVQELLPNIVLNIIEKEQLYR